MNMQKLFGLLQVIALSAVADDWPHWRGPAYNGISNEKGWVAAFPADGPKQLWKANVGIGFSSKAKCPGP